MKRSARSLPLKVPSPKFNRKIGIYKGKTFTIDGDPMDGDRYAAYVESVLPTAEDRATLRDIFKENDWIIPRKAGEVS